MTTITSDTSIMDILGGGPSAKFFSLLEDNNEFMEDMDDRDELAYKRQEKVLKEFESMSDAVDGFQSGISESFKQTTARIKDSIANPINKMRSESITAYTEFTESIHNMKDGVSQKLTDVKEGFSTKVSDLKAGFTGAVAMTNSALEGMSVKMEAFSNLPTEQQILLAGKIIADGVMNTVSSIPDVVSASMEKLDKGISAVGGFMKSSTGYLKGLFTKSEESEDIGGTSGLVDTDTKPKSDAGAGIGGILGALPIPKGLGKFAKMAGSFAGKLALPLAVLAAGFSFVEGIKNASEIVGKTNEEMSSVEKAGAGLASVVSSLTFGLISAKSIYSEGKQVIDSVSGFASDMYNKLPDGIKGVTDEIGKFLFSADGGVFSGIGDLFNSTIEGIAKGDWGTVALNVITAPFKLLFGGNGILANAFNGVFELLPNSFQESITEFADTIFGWFDKIKNFASDLIPDSIKNFFGDIAESDTAKTVSKGIGAVTDFMGWTDKKEKEKKEESKSKSIKKSISSVAPLARPMDALLGGGADKVAKQLAKNKALVAQRKSQPKSSSEIITKTFSAADNPELTKRIKEGRARLRSRVFGKPKLVKDSDTATKKSKVVMNRRQDVQPVIIQAPAQAQRAQGSGKQLNTGTSIGDTELAVMNSNMMD